MCQSQHDLAEKKDFTRWQFQCELYEKSQHEDQLFNINISGTQADHTKKYEFKYIKFT